MKKKPLKSLSYLLFGFLLGGLFILASLDSEVKSLENVFHEHADFALFIEGEQFDFSDFKYMSIEPCVPNAEPKEELTLADSVHLHNNDGGVIHVHAPGVTYGDFFESLGMELGNASFTDDKGNVFENEGQKAWTFMVNGEVVPTLADREIRNLDRVLIRYGDAIPSEDLLLQEYGAIDNRACIASGSCSHREPAAPENCGAYEKPFFLEMIGL